VAPPPCAGLPKPAAAPGEWHEGEKQSEVVSRLQFFEGDILAVETPDPVWPQLPAVRAQGAAGKPQEGAGKEQPGRAGPPSEQQQQQQGAAAAKKDAPAAEGGTSAGQQQGAAAGAGPSKAGPSNAGPSAAGTSKAGPSRPAPPVKQKPLKKKAAHQPLKGIKAGTKVAAAAGAKQQAQKRASVKAERARRAAALRSRAASRQGNSPFVSGFGRDPILHGDPAVQREVLTHGAKIADATLKVCDHLTCVMHQGNMCDGLHVCDALLTSRVWTPPLRWLTSHGSPSQLR
jgi:hypothetical protein